MSAEIDDVVRLLVEGLALGMGDVEDRLVVLHGTAMALKEGRSVRVIIKEKR
jgi:hypothetical protein